MTTGRKAYPGKPLDIMVSHGIGVEHGAAEIANVLVNGKRLGEIMESMRTPNKHDIRPETKYREAFSIAVATVRLGLGSPEIERISVERARLACRKVGVQKARDPHVAAHNRAHCEPAARRRADPLGMGFGQ